MKLKNEILQIYNLDDNNKIEENMTIVTDIEQTLVDINKLKKVFSNAKKLVIEIISYNKDNQYFKLEIDPFGYINSKRRKKDGVTYFGFILDDRDNNNEVDFAINNNDNVSPSEETLSLLFIMKLTSL